MSKTMLNLKKQLTQLIEHMNQAVDDAYKRGYEKGKAESADSAYAEGYTNAESNFREMRDQMDQESYQCGLDDAWDAARKIALITDDGGYSMDEMSACFGEDWGCSSSVFRKYRPEEAIEKIREYEERKAQEDAEIKVGDEVKAEDNVAGVSIRINGNLVSVIRTNDERGYVEYLCHKDGLTKTGRHVDLSEIFGGEEE